MGTATVVLTSGACVTKAGGPVAGEEVRAAAFATLFAEERDRLFRFACVMCGSRDVAEDLAAEAFARLYPKWRRGHIDDPAAYLRRVVLNLVRGRYRRLAVQRRAAVRIERGQEMTAASADVRIADQEVVRAALRALAPRQRAAVILRFMEDRSEVETAAILGVTLGTVKSQVSRALGHLRVAMDADVQNRGAR